MVTFSKRALFLSGGTTSLWCPRDAKIVPFLSNNSYGFTHPNNVWVGGFVLGNQVFRYPVKKKYVHPEILFLFVISLRFIIGIEHLSQIQ